VIGAGDGEQERLPVQAGGIADPGRQSSRHCDESQSVSRQSWQACVTQLRQAGRDREAAAEQKLLDQAFPQ